MNIGKFIVIEGIDGSGITTLQKGIVSYFKSKEVPILGTKEPTDGPVGCLLKQFITGRTSLFTAEGLNNPSAAKTYNELAIAELSLLFAADRIDHINNVLRPALLSGYNIICDRYVYSTLAYQLDKDRSLWSWLIGINGMSFSSIPLPDIVLYLNLPIEVAGKRRKSRDGQHSDIFDATLENVKENYKYVFSHVPPMTKIVEIDAAKGQEEVLNTSCEEIKRLFWG
jgi:dTMP kinase